MCRNQRRVKLIFRHNIRNHTKEIIRITEIFAIFLLVLFTIILLKFNILYKITVNDEVIGYVTNKKEIEEEINNYIENESKGVAFRNLEAKTEYEPVFVSKEATNKDEVIGKIKENISTTYTAYGIQVDEEVITYVASEEEADKIVADLQNEYKDKIVVNIGVKQIFDKTEIATVDESTAVSKVRTENLDVKVAKVEAEKKAAEEKKKQETITNSKVIVAVRPVTGGKITSRFGERSSVRSSSHTGLDIATSSGTPIKAAASGTVIFSGYKGSYGYLIKIKCDNGYEMWYGHCSKLYAKTGQRVSAGDKIAAVGSTGNSTGPHLHFEIRKNGKALNPQNYM